MKKALLFVSLLSLSFLSSCNQVTYDDRPIIVSSFFAVSDLVKKVVGNKYNVITLTEGGVEPHDYEPTPGQIKTMYNADIIFCNGLGIEHWATDLPKALKEKVCFLGENENIDYITIDGAKDPHIWLNPLYANLELETIKNKIIELDSTNKNYYEERYTIYSTELNNLDSYLKQEFSSYKDYKFVTSHKAFSYFAQAYNLTNVALNGLSPEDEPSPSQLASLIQEIKDLKISTIFYESFSSSSIADTISKETNTKVSTLLTMESIEKESDGYEDYCSLMLGNALKLLEAFEDYGKLD